MKGSAPNLKKRTKRQVEKYAWSSTIAEIPDTQDAIATWGVAFNYRPSVYHYRGKAGWWCRRQAQLAAAESGIYPELSVMKNGGENDDGTPMYGDSEAESGDDENLCSPMRTLTKDMWINVFATVNSNTIRIYQARLGKEPKLLRVFKDADDEEVFYTVAFTFNADNTEQWWVLAAGGKGVVRAISIKDNRVVRSLFGHGAAVNDIKVHPRDPALVVSASKDESLRLWNLRTGSPVAMFAGLKGHRGEVLSVDFDRCGNRFASCGIDNSVRVWQVTEDEDVVKAILESHKAADSGYDKYLFTENGSKKVLRVPVSQFPSFLTRKVHKHYVDCVKWIGDDMLLSKSVHNRVYLWELGKDRESLAAPASEYKLLEEYVVDNCNVWFVRFGVDRFQRVIACGNENVSVCTLRCMLMSFSNSSMLTELLP